MPSTTSKAFAPGSFRPGRWVLACVLMAWLLATLAPGLSRLLVHANGGGSPAQAGWIEVCTAHGMDWVTPDGTLASERPDHDPANTLDACGHCTLAVDRFTPPIPHFAWGALSPAPQPLPTLHQPPLPQRVVALAQARGPPRTA